MPTLERQANHLYTKRDKLERELAEIDAQLAKLRSQYMAETSTYGLHPAAFRRAVEIRKTA